MAKPPFDPKDSLEALLHTAQARFGEVHFQQMELAGGPLDVLQIKDMPGYIDKLIARAGAKGQVRLPLWAKIWPCCMVQAMFLEKCPVVADGRYLEIGAGVGLAGLALARRGVRVMITDLEPDAMLFCRINALRNGLEDRVDLRVVDFTRDRLDTTFDGILGCEVLFRAQMFAPLRNFLGVHLKERPDAEVVLGTDGNRESTPFFQAASAEYDIMRRDVPITDLENGERKTASLFRMRRKA
ncbi:MAG: methyltransferase [Desulfovibrio sp.]|nr:methyltransferase [Desulfovibrio sp.]